jgi:hypothetical protein
MKIPACGIFFPGADSSHLSACCSPKKYTDFKQLDALSI